MFWKVPGKFPGGLAYQGNTAGGQYERGRARSGAPCAPYSRTPVVQYSRTRTRNSGPTRNGGDQRTPGGDWGAGPHPLPNAHPVRIRSVGGMNPHALSPTMLTSTPALRYSSTPVLQHPSTPVLQHSSTPALQYSSTPVLQYSSTPALQYSRTIM